MNEKKFKDVINKIKKYTKEKDYVNLEKYVNDIEETTINSASNYVEELINGLK